MNLRKIVSIFFILVLACGQGWADKQNAYDELKTFTEVLDIIQKSYVKPPSSKELVYGAIKGMLNSLDPHSSFLTPDEFKELQIETKGEFGGVGIEITVKDGWLTVVSPIEDTPAYKAGLKPGDKIIKINNKPTKDMGLTEAVKLIRGPEGTKVILTIFREGLTEPKEFEIIRSIISIKSVKVKPLEDQYGYIRLASFQEDTSEELEKTLKTLEKEHPLKGIILDMRNNPGGLLDEAVKVADEFLEDGLIVYTEGRLKDQGMRFTAHKNKHPHHYPLVVLVNEGTASAAEIVAGALQDRHRALIVGRPTFGKGSVQTIMPLEDGSALRLTTAWYYTPNGRSIQVKGINPDLVFERDVSKAKYPSIPMIREEDLERHLEGAEELPTPEKETEKTDFLIDIALQVLKNWDAFTHLSY